MWAHLKTKKPQNSSQCTLAGQRAVTDSSKPLLCHCRWFCRHSTDQLTGKKHKENRFRLYTKGINSIMLRHKYDDTLQRYGQCKLSTVPKLMESTLYICYVTTLRYLAVPWVMESVTRLHKIPWPFIEFATTIRDTVLPRTAHEDPEGEYRYSSTLSLTSKLDGGVVNPTPRPLYLRGGDPIPLEQDVEWSRGPVWTGAENFALTGIRSPDRPARSEPRLRITALRPLSAEAKVHLQTSPCRICGGQRGNWTGFSPRTSVFPCQYHSTDAAYSCAYDRRHVLSVNHSIVKHFFNRKG
jgi:hypothetical protein